MRHPDGAARLRPPARAHGAPGRDPPAGHPARPADRRPGGQPGRPGRVGRGPGARRLRAGQRVRPAVRHRVVGSTGRGAEPAPGLRAGHAPPSSTSIPTRPTPPGWPPWTRPPRRWPPTARDHAGPLLDHLDRDTTARDLDQLRQALGQATLTYRRLLLRDGHRPGLRPALPHPPAGPAARRGGRTGLGPAPVPQRADQRPGPDPADPSSTPAPPTPTARSTTRPPPTTSWPPGWRRSR